MYILRQICLASKPLFLPLQNGNEQYSLFTVVWRFSKTKHVKAFSSLLPNANSVPNFSSTFLWRIMPVFHFSPFCPLIPPPLHSWLFSLFLFFFFLADLVSLVSPLSPLWMFVLTVFIFPSWTFLKFLSHLPFAGVFCFTWGSSPVHIDVNIDCWFWTSLRKRGWKLCRDSSYRA